MSLISFPPGAEFSSAQTQGWMDRLVKYINSMLLTPDIGAATGTSLTLSGQPCIQVCDGGTQTRTGSTYVLMDGFTTITIDVLGEWSANSLYTATKAGIYEVYCNTTVTPNGAIAEGSMRIYKNGSHYSPFKTQTATATVVAAYQNMSIGGYVSLAVGNTLSVYTNRSAGAVDLYYQESTLSIRLVQ